MGQGKIFYCPDLDTFDERNPRNIIGYPAKRTLSKAFTDKNKVADPIAKALLGGEHSTALAAAPMTIMPQITLADSTPSPTPAVQPAKREKYESIMVELARFRDGEYFLLHENNKIKFNATTDTSRSGIYHPEDAEPTEEMEVDIYEGDEEFEGSQRP
ncbi:hypothetical protein BJX65DRAFT_307302 [Aspergillus insuetus]